MEQYITPAYWEEKFHCPHCGVLAHQKWFSGHNTYSLNLELFSSYESDRDYSYEKFAVNICAHCEKVSFWDNEVLVYPTSGAPKPNPDMPADVKDIYEEAMKVHNISSRASTALLRLALEKLLPQLGAKQAKIDTMIAELVSKGLPKDIEKALDSLRVIGNEAVHPVLLI